LSNAKIDNSSRLSSTGQIAGTDVAKIVNTQAISLRECRVLLPLTRFCSPLSGQFGKSGKRSSGQRLHLSARKIHQEPDLLGRVTDQDAQYEAATKIRTQPENHVQFIWEQGRCTLGLRIGCRFCALEHPNAAPGG